MSGQGYKVAIHVEVHDEQELFDAALDRMVDDGLLPTADDYGDRSDDERVIGTRDEPDVSGCLIMLLDPGVSPPGTSIIESAVED